MNFGDWKAQLVEVPGVAGQKLYLYRHLVSGATEFLTENGKTRKVNEGQLDTGNNHFVFLTYEQLQVIADAFANKGIKTVNDSRNAGLLEATNKHLDDMRRLVFEPVQHVNGIDLHTDDPDTTEESLGGAQ